MRNTVWVSCPAVCSLVRGCTLGRSREFSTSTCDLSSRAVAYTIYSVMPLPVSELGGNLCSRIAWQSVPRVALCMHTTGCAPCYSNSLCSVTQHPHLLLPRSLVSHTHAHSPSILTRFSSTLSTLMVDGFALRPLRSAVAEEVRG